MQHKVSIIKKLPKIYQYLNNQEVPLLMVGRYKEWIFASLNKVLSEILGHT